MNFSSLKVESAEKGVISVKSRFWEVLHDARKGGCITSIRFFHGSGENILQSPIMSYFGSYQDVLNDAVDIRMVDRNGFVEVEVYGELKDIHGSTIDTKYAYTYKYSEGHIKITQKYRFEKPADVKQVGIGCMNLTSKFSYFAARPSHVRADKPYGNCTALWGEVYFAGKPAFEEKNIPLYMAVFNPGVEGIEFIPGSDLEEWTKQLTDYEDLGVFQIKGESKQRSTRITIEPLGSRVRGYSIPHLSGNYVFHYYLGLPKVRDKLPRKYMHMSFGNHPWPSDEDIRRWAYKGVSVVRIHNDYHPSGDFWHDGSWPPYDEKGMRELKRVINTCHKYGIKIVPYFSLYEINPKSEAFADGYIVWRRTIDERGFLIETYPPNYFFGFGMCLRSGWKDFLKKYVEKVVKTLGFDGVYYDYAHYWFCSNRHHSRGDHTNIDELIEFLEYTRSLVGEDGVILLHQSGWFPSVLVENYADGHIMLEDWSEWSELPPLERFPPNTLHLRFMNVASKIPCPLYQAVDAVKATWDLCAKCSVLGAFPWQSLGLAAEPVLALFEAFRAFDLSQFKFKDYTAGFVKTSNEAVKSAVYFNEDKVLVVLANVEDKPVEGFKWTVDLERIGWCSTCKYHVVNTLGEPILLVEGRDLTGKGVEDALEGLRFKVYAITRHRDGVKYVLYNTRPWIEEYIDGRLIVKTRGPEGQEALLKIYSPEKPREVVFNSKTLKEDVDWIFDESTRIGTITYKYTDTKMEVTIQIS
ncbi:hypothetical protein KEJ27_01675 [Candidatus Bathyarchaeota archaeon]|nr:hypothetical protein [Candidatus Bathyarchaeota archaeon]MBS7618565.1 hypothetical protein [Candidatus Bathyarchaeota archaeon]